MSDTSREWQRLTVEQQRILESHQQTPPVLVGEVAKELGLIVKSVTLSASISGKIETDEGQENSFIIRINRHEPKYRQRFTVAHEIAHYLLHQDEIKSDGIVDTVLYRSSLSNRLEAEANRLAADIIMPWHLLREAIQGKDLDDEETIVDIAQEFNVSKVALAIRLGIKIE